MDAGTLSSSENRPDPHGWNTVENFLHIHQTRLAEHPFVDTVRPNTLQFERYEVDGNAYFVLFGAVYCLGNVIVEVEKYYETRTIAGREQLRGFSYRYNASVRNRHNILRYDNGHDDAPDEYHRHLFDGATGRETDRRIITRYELPTLYDILSEIQELLGSPS